MKKMQKNNLTEYLKQLEKLDSQITDDTDPDELMKEVNKVISNISEDVQIELKEHALKATLKFINESNNPDPEFAKEGDSGFDLRAFIDRDVIIPEGQVRMIPTGLYFEVNKGLEVQVRSRSGLAAKSNMWVLNSPGTIDCVTEDTNIKTSNGDITIKKIFNENIRELISFNEENFTTESDIIDDIWIINDIDCVKIITENCSVIIPSTKEVYTKRGWIQSKNLTLDDEILIF
jgi:dUTP pyrophosphatase